MLFGNVNIHKEELKIKDYNLFRAYYCGLCKALGKRYNQITRLGLRYDMTFLALVADGVSMCDRKFMNEGCIKHIGKHCICMDNPAIDYSADISIILIYHKLCDDISDNRSIKAFFARIPFYRAYRKACKRYPEVASYVSERLNELSKLESSRCSSIDAAADPFSLLTKYIFGFYDKSLECLGYNIGRFIYITDAYADIAKDIKTGSYNPYIEAYDKNYLKSEEFVCQVKGSLNMTLSAIATEYANLNIGRNKAVLDNIIYMGLRETFDKLFDVTEVSKEND